MDQGNPFDNKGDSFEKNFTKLFSGGADSSATAAAPKEEAKVVAKPQATPASKAVAPAAPKRAPVTNASSRGIECLYYVDETLTFNPDKLNMSMAFNLSRAEKTNIIINTKVK